MEALKQTALDLNYLRGELETLHYINEGDYIEMASTQSRIFLKGLGMIGLAIKELESLRKLNAVYVMVNRLLPHQRTPEHVDYLDPTPLQPGRHPTLERWHLPVTTNNWAFFYCDGKEHYMPLGWWYGPIPYWKKHWVSNGGEELRTHLIVDLDTPEPQGEY